MKIARCILVVAVLGVSYLAFKALSKGEASSEPRISRDLQNPMQVYFSPKGGCAQAIIAEIRQAKKSILFQSYSFTNEEIAGALIEAHKRGVSVQGIMDKSVLKEKSCLDIMLEAGIPILIDSKHPIAHSKIMVIDEVVVTGSYNWTHQAENNAENLLIIRNPAMAVLYTKNWNAHSEHSKPKP